MKVTFFDRSKDNIKTMTCTSIEFNQYTEDCLLINSREGRSIKVDTNCLISIEDVRNESSN